MTGRYGLRGGSKRMGYSGPLPGMQRQTRAMGGWWEDLTSSVSNVFNTQNWDINPTKSPYWSSTVAPALDVVGSVAGVYYTGVPIPAGTIATKTLGGGQAPAQTPQKPYTPATFNAPPVGAVAPGAVPAGTLPAGGISTPMLLAGLAAGGGLLYYLAQQQDARKSAAA